MLSGNGSANGYLMLEMNVRQVPALNVMTGPLRSAVSRTSTASAEEISTQAPPLSPE